MHKALTLRARIKEVTEKKIIVTCSLFSRKKECVRGELVGIKVPVVFWKK